MPDDRTRRGAAAGPGWFRWWTGRSGPARVELITHWGFYAYAVGFGVAGAAVVTDGLRATWADTAAVLLFFAYGVLGGTAASQALRWAVGRRARPTVLIAAAVLAGAAVLLLVLARQPSDPTRDEATGYVFALGSAILPVAVLTVQALPARRIAALVTLVVALVTAGSLAAGLPAVAVFVNFWATLWFALASVFFSRTSGWMMQIMWELLDARDTRAQLAVAEERLRFARDLHDVMGSNLSVLALQSELAAQLARRGATDAAVGQMEEVQRIAREAQAEIRAVVRGYREADLATELSGARGVLESAGIDCAIDTPGPEGAVAATLAPSVQVALGWVVREAITNVLRHSDAASCEIRLRVEGERAVLTVANNGARTPAPAPAPSSGGTGLAGLGERLAALGGTLTTHAQDGTFVLTASVPRQEER
ncbi:sensor histidine kinase [Streptomyces avicenniae]|uniref:sensor histidine kinase n=1 Tax=Streptomyces avicenniae TaxID=500153 RepID=UPI00069A9EAA|nr:histidine kinase [Streptomyces avicenniae]